MIAAVKRDPIIARRDKLVAGLKDQKLVHAATLKKEDHLVERDKWMTNDTGERVLVKTHRRIRPWFFAQDGGWYVQCRYGARVIAADGTNNAVFVKSLADVLRVLDALLNAAAAGELDRANLTLHPNGDVGNISIICRKVFRHSINHFYPDF